MHEILELKDVLKGELIERGYWFYVNLGKRTPWPVKASKINFEGKNFFVIPVTKERYPAIAVKGEGYEERLKYEKLLMRFLSVLSWVESKAIDIEGMGAGSLPNPMGRHEDFGMSLQKEFDFLYFPHPENDKQKLALALMREARSLNHPAYSFLTYYRVIEVAVPAKQRGDWINAQCSTLQHHRAKEAIKKLIDKGVDIQDHIYKGRRQAIAHASSDPIVDPDDTSLTRELWGELPIMEALAEVAIETVLGLKTRSTNFREHLYELAGFKQIFGETNIQKILASEEIQETTVNVPELRIEIRGQPRYAPFLRLNKLMAWIEDGKIAIVAKNDDEQFGIRFRLNFKNERLEFNFDSDLLALDDGSAGAADNMAELGRFTRDYLGNGELQIFNADTDQLIARKDAFIPMNFYLDFDAANAGIERWKQMAIDRELG